ncbi:MAG: carbon-nitrogen hydrolase family protein [Rubrivivax sp.]
MKIAAVQMVSTPDWPTNREAAAALVAEAAGAGAALVGLPEYFCLLGQRDTDKLALAEAPGSGPIQQFLSDTARRHGIWLVGGTLPVRADGDDSGTGPPQRVLNRCCVFAPDGREAAHYDKIHLFAYDNGSERYDEGRTLQAGSEPTALRAGTLQVGLSVCYDLRFPELYRRLMGRPGTSGTSGAQQGTAPCDLLCVPSAFTHTTGRAHWELLLRARAVENQCYVLAPAQGGRHDNGRHTWGHSLICDPWGEVVAVREEEGAGVVLADVDAARIAQVRCQLPALSHRRL